MSCAPCDKTKNCNSKKKVCVQPTVFGLCGVEFGQLNVLAGQSSIDRLFVLVHDAAQPYARLGQACFHTQSVRVLNVQNLQECVDMKILQEEMSGGKHESNRRCEAENCFEAATCIRDFSARVDTKSDTK